MENIENKIRRMRNVYSSRYRIEYPNAIYHMIQRAPGDEKLFLKREDYLYMLSLMKELVRKFNWEIFSFVLMSNHLHILFKIIRENLSQGGKFLFGNYGNYFNRKYDRKGPVFCKPFRAFVCLTDSYLLGISIYIHLNPYKAGIVEDPSKYKWSSINLFLSSKNFDTFVSYRSILEILNSDLNRAREMYREMLKEAANLEYGDVFETPDFIHRFCIKLNKVKSGFRTMKSSREWDITQEIEKFKNLKYDRESKMKKRAIIERLMRQNYKITEIANFLHLSRIQVYRILKNVT